MAGRDSGANRQWLKVRDGQGLTGWCKFAPVDGAPPKGRWRIQPRAAGGSANFNGIVFSDDQPAFQQLPILSTEAADKSK
ncbi:MAG: hypothetical protein P4L50_08410 [Anaerolineaceae bacterium]|nr:hypothetical protein [Anaerolineaceae bacterium]